MSLNAQNEQLESAGRVVALLILRCFIFAHDGISQEVMCISHIGLLLKVYIVYLKWVAHVSAQKLHFNQLSLYVVDRNEGICCSFSCQTLLSWVFSYFDFRFLLIREKIIWCFP